MQNRLEASQPPVQVAADAVDSSASHTRCFEGEMPAPDVRAHQSVLQWTETTVVDDAGTWVAGSLGGTAAVGVGGDGVRAVEGTAFVAVVGTPLGLRSTETSAQVV